MPNKNGHALAVDVLASASHAKIIVHTSFDNPKLTKDLIIRGVSDVVYKPANYEAFAAKAKGLVVRDRIVREKQESVDSPAEKSGDGAKAQDKGETEGHGPVSLSEMKTKLSDVSKVLPVSRAALDVSNMVRSDSFDAEQVATAVQRDPALAVKVLQLANNPFYNSTGKKITDIKQAVTRIGQKRVGEFALAMSAFASVTPDTLPWMDVDLAWRRSVAAGIAVELLVKLGKHISISEGLLFSALMHSSGRAVLGTHYPKRYKAMVKLCAENDETLLKHEKRVFPENHAQVMCDLLADGDIPAEVYQPLKHILNDYPALSRLPEPMRTKVELVKLAILIGQIAVGSWEDWDQIEFPPRQVLDRLGIDDVGIIIEQAEAQIAGIANFRSDSQTKVHHPRLELRRLAYCNLSEERFDFLAEIVPSMGIKLNPADFKTRKLHGSALVNRIGAVPTQSTTTYFKNCDEVVFVRDADRMANVGNVGVNIAVPCSYAALRSVCWEAASES
jgi:HD-like signal output (HDOD) protein